VSKWDGGSLSYHWCSERKDVWAASRDDSRFSIKVSYYPGVGDRRHAAAPWGSESLPLTQIWEKREHLSSIKGAVLGEERARGRGVQEFAD